MNRSLTGVVMKGLREKLNTLGQNINNKAFLEKFEIVRSDRDGLSFLNYDREGKPNRFNNLCRGTIFRGDKLVMLPFTRFFNLHESYAAVIDWRYARVLEKLDGTMLPLWFDDEENRWRISSKRMVDELPVQRFGAYGTSDVAIIFKEFFPSYKEMEKTYWYIFEIVTGENSITDYPESRHGLHLIAVRHRKSLNEVNPDRIRDIVRDINEPRVNTPELYDLWNSKAVMRMFNGKSDDFEGVVIVDNNFNRIKIKQTSYLKLQYKMDNVSSFYNAIDIVLDNEQGEILAYFPRMKPRFDEIEKRLNMLKAEIMTSFGMYNHIRSRKDFALAVKNQLYRAFLFRLRDGIDLRRQFQRVGGKRLARLI